MSTEKPKKSNLNKATEDFTESLLKEVGKEKSENEQGISEGLNINRIQNFATEVQKAGFPKVKGKRAQQILEVFAHKLDQYQKDLEDLSKEEVVVDEINLSAEEKLKREEKRKKRQEKIEQIANEIFIIACASNLEMDKSLEFCKECNLGKDINKFGENGFSPLAAAMLAGKGGEDLQKLKENGADENARDKLGRSAQEIVGLIEKFDSKELQQDNSQDFERSLQRGRGFVKKAAPRKSASSNSEDENSVEGADEMDSEARSMLIGYLDELKKKVGKKTKDGKSSGGFFGSDSDDENSNPNLSAAEAQMLEKMGIDQNNQSALNSALFNAVKSGNATLPLLLVKLGADVNHKENGLTVLGAALISGSETLIPILVYLSTPETRRSTLEVNRTLVDRLEDKIDALSSMVDSVGLGRVDVKQQITEEKNNPMQQQESKKELELQKAKEEKEKNDAEQTKKDADQKEKAYKEYSDNSDQTKDQPKYKEKPIEELPLVTENSDDDLNMEEIAAEVGKVVFDLGGAITKAATNAVNSTFAKTTQTNAREDSSQSH